MKISGLTKPKKSIRLRIADARRVAENILKRNGIYGYGGGCGDLGKYDMDRILNTTDEEAIRSDWEAVGNTLRGIITEEMPPEIHQIIEDNFWN